MIIKPASRISTVKEYYFSKKLKEIAALRASGKDILNLGIGSPDLPPPPEAIEVLIEKSQQDGAHKYQSYVGAPQLREAFAEWYGRHFSVDLNPNSEILPLIGSKEGIMHISQTFLEAGDEVLVPNPGYPAYRATANLAGATVVEYNLREADWFPDFEELEKRDLTKVKIMWVNYPNMPTGAAATSALFDQLVAFAKKHHILVCNDNPYSFVLHENQMSLLAADGAKDVCLELNSLSKSHNMAGWRVGLLAGKAEYLSEILKFKSNMDSGMFLPVQLAAAKALEMGDIWFAGLNDIYKKRQQKVFEIMDLLGCEYSKDRAGMFVWAKAPSTFKDGYALSDKFLYEADVFLTPGGIFGSQGNGYIRVSLCAGVAVFEEAIKRIKKVQEQESS